LLAILVAYDAMTHDRVFQKAKSKEQALAELTNHSGTQFDPKLTKIFLENINSLLPHE
jgi:HD-GYP domain-containing protein (c-di-GMP phosphodiesterase class II)